MKYTIILLLLVITTPLEGFAFSQQRLIQMSCASGSSTYWKSQDQHTEMCAARQLRIFMPPAPDTWVKEDINWTMKTSINEKGFREPKEISAIFDAFNIYPFVKYIASDKRGAIYIYGTTDHDKVTALQKDFQQQAQEYNEELTVSIDDATRYYLDPTVRTSPYMTRARFRQSHVSITDKAYLIFYFEDVVDDDFMTFFINSVDYQNIQRYLDQMIQRYPLTVNTNGLQHEQ